MALDDALRTGTATPAQLQQLETRVSALESSYLPDNGALTNKYIINDQGEVEVITEAAQPEVKGDVLSADAIPEPANLPVGEDGQILTAASAAELGIEWEDAPLSEPEGPWLEETIVGTGENKAKEKTITPPVGARALLVHSMSTGGGLVSLLKWRGAALASLVGSGSIETFAGNTSLIDNVGTEPGILSWTEPVGGVPAYLRLVWIYASTAVTKNGDAVTAFSWGPNHDTEFTAVELTKVGITHGVAMNTNGLAPNSHNGTLLNYLLLPTGREPPWNNVRVTFITQTITEADVAGGMPIWAYWLAKNPIEVPYLNLKSVIYSAGLKVA